MFYVQLKKRSANFGIHHHLLTKLIVYNLKYIADPTHENWDGGYRSQLKLEGSHTYKLNPISHSETATTTFQHAQDIDIVRHQLVTQFSTCPSRLLAII
jgi:hypothetical protein